MRTDGKVIIYDGNHLKDRSGARREETLRMNYHAYLRSLALQARAMSLANLKPKERAVFNQKADVLVEESLKKPLPPL